METSVISRSKTNIISTAEEYARRHLPSAHYDYYATGAHDQVTLRDNIDAFKCFNITAAPRTSNAITSVDTAVQIFGKSLSTPIFIAPTAMMGMAHPDKELAAAAAAAECGSVYVQSTVSTTSIADVAKHVPHCTRWFQLYVYTDWQLTLQLIRRAEQNGFTALVVTVDTPYTGVKENDIRNNFTLPTTLSLPNIATSATEGAAQRRRPKGIDRGNVSQINVRSAALTWTTIKHFRAATSLPIILKGIMTGEDAALAAECGDVDGVYVSNHGGRQCDTVPATVLVLAEVIDAVAGRLPVFVDGGVRCGADAFVCLALGATAVLVGRPILWGLTLHGQDGVKDVIQCITNELKQIMQQTECTRIDDIQHRRNHLSLRANM